MSTDSQHNIQYVAYKEIAKKMAREYYHNNKEKIKEKNKIKCDLLTVEEKKRNNKNIINNGLIKKP